MLTQEGSECRLVHVMPPADLGSRSLSTDDTAKLYSRYSPQQIIGTISSSVFLAIVGSFFTHACGKKAAMGDNDTFAPSDNAHAEIMDPAFGGTEANDSDWGHFEQVLGEVVGRLSNIEEGRFDQVMTSCLRDLAEPLRFDRSSLMEFAPHDSRLRVTHTWAGEDIPSVNVDSLVEDQLPWLTQQIRSGYIVCFSGSASLPPAANKERAYVLAHGVKVSITVPLLSEGQIIGAVGFSCFEQERPLSPALMSRLRLVGEVLALGIRHYQYAQGLQSISQTMDQLSLVRRGQSASHPHQLRYIASKIMQSEHQERLRMGQILQEDVMQTLAGIGMLMKSAGAAETNLQAKAIGHSLTLLSETLGKLQRVSMQLRPGLCPRVLIQNLRWLASQVERMDDLHIEIAADETIEPVCDEVGIYLYNATRKLLESVETLGSKHVSLEVRRVAEEWIRLTVSNESIRTLFLSIEENYSSGPFDLLTLREQAELLGGRLEIHCPVEKTASVIITIRG